MFLGLLLKIIKIINMIYIKIIIEYIKIINKCCR